MKSAAHNESNCASEKKESRSEDANKSFAVVNSNLTRRLVYFETPGGFNEFHSWLDNITVSNYRKIWMAIE